MRAISWSIALVGVLGLPCNAQPDENTPDEAKLIVEAFDREIAAILSAERLKRKRRTGLTVFVRSLLEKL